jgi:hypothetical protein
LNVEGFFSGGQSNTAADITSSTAGTHYRSVSGSSGIFTVSPDGQLTAKGPGTDTVVVTNGQLSIKVPVEVNGNFTGSVLYSNTIDFPAIDDKTIGDQPFALAASASDGNSANFTLVSGNAVVNNGIVTITGPGPVTIKASDSGNAYFAAAPDALQTFCVSPGQANSIIGDTVTCTSQKAYHIASAPGVTYQWQVSEGGIVNASDSTALITWTTDGKHTVMVTPAGGTCLGQPAQLSVVVTTLPQVPLSKAGTIKECQGKTVLLTVPVSTGQVQWYLDSTVIPGAKADSMVVSKDGNYFARITYSDGCVASSDSAIVTIDSLPPPSVTIMDSTSSCRDTTTMQSSLAAAYQWYLDTTAIPGATSRSFRTINPGQYSVEVANAAGCKARSSNVTITAGHLQLKPTIHFINGALASDSLQGNQWFLNDTLLSQVTEQQWTPTVPGSYTLQITVDGCKSEMSDPYIVPKSQIRDPAVRLFPNPMYNELTILNSGLGQIQLQLYDVNGKVVLTAEVGFGTKAIDVHRLPRGVYFARITDEKTGKTTKGTFIKL